MYDIEAVISKYGSESIGNNASSSFSWKKNQGSVPVYTIEEYAEKVGGDADFMKICIAVDKKAPRYKELNGVKRYTIATLNSYFKLN